MRCTTGMVRAVFLAPRCSRSLSICRVSLPPRPCVLTTLIAGAPLAHPALENDLVEGILNDPGSARTLELRYYIPQHRFFDHCIDRRPALSTECGDSRRIQRRQH